MSKQYKALIAMSILAIALIIYLVATSKVETVGENKFNQLVTSPAKRHTPSDPAVLEVAYRQTVKQVLLEADEALAAGKSQDVVDKLSAVKIALLDLTVPDQYRDAHLKFVLALSRAKSAIEEGDERACQQAVALFNDALRENKWLNN